MIDSILCNLCVLCGRTFVVYVRTNFKMNLFLSQNQHDGRASYFVYTAHICVMIVKNCTTHFMLYFIMKKIGWIECLFSSFFETKVINEMF